MEVMAAIEESNECSGGLCSSNPNTTLPTYLFSNVNDGVPTLSCHPFVKELILGNISFYRLGFVLTLSITVVANCIYTLIFLRRLWKLCCNRKKKDKSDADKKGKDDIEVETPDTRTDHIELELEQ